MSKQVVHLGTIRREFFDEVMAAIRPMGISDEDFMARFFKRLLDRLAALMDEGCKWELIVTGSANGEGWTYEVHLPHGVTVPPNLPEIMAGQLHS